MTTFDFYMGLLLVLAVVIYLDTYLNFWSEEAYETKDQIWALLVGAGSVGALLLGPSVLSSVLVVVVGVMVALVLHYHDLDRPQTCKDLTKLSVCCTVMVLGVYLFLTMWGTL